MNKRKITKAISRAVAVAGVFAAIFGLILCMCETPELADQLRNMLVGLALMFLGSTMVYIGGSGRWMEGPYAGL